MKLTTIADGSIDGRLHIVTRNLERMMPAQAASTLQRALDDWEVIAPRLEEEFAALSAAPDAEGTLAFVQANALAPLPRAWQWLDGSAFASHGELMSQVFGIENVAQSGRPLMYQGVSDRFLSSREDVPFPNEDDGIDFEGEFGIITDRVPMGVSVEAARHYIRLVVLINDWSLRRIAPIEMGTGFGWIQAKPPCSVAPVAVTPDELGSAWQRCQVDLPLIVDYEGSRFGAAIGSAMDYGFDRLVSHAAYSRSLVPGTIIGSGTVSNANFRDIGSSCIAERRGIEMVDLGEAVTPYMKFGESVRMKADLPDGTPMFGSIDQRVAPVPRSA
ncbi:fumarylacetoacetate hydrolase [Rhizobium sp. Root149]|uniref:fumarylacetoacetate hydrolase family protein n=1 Tax=Rhizobium sp. Root149 TaxID=1736473 RepID=UPI000714E062|nr:fumarylacetoacetate hydrolase family protein [Rhizobium sp. Root149]KQZ46642.1 fumarylacetoacetate hydrolase [Rhizobium sp. Root149]